MEGSGKTDVASAWRFSAATGTSAQSGSIIRRPRLRWLVAKAPRESAKVNFLILLSFSRRRRSGSIYEAANTLEVSRTKKNKQRELVKIW